ncbi:GL18006 [Drosophila persimilis]|uniref:GL18006 n=1 Tax=Drosophila persimilis TaxID=7234 RepID=B4H248_DROPE|nr:uncharacterized protein LOC6599873 [Drosophila persimilis]EDW30400.1 GL18006 [Drosophila persimilis]
MDNRNKRNASRTATGLSGSMVPFSLMTLREMDDIEAKGQDASVDAYEASTRAWRNQFKNPNLVPNPIGMEFSSQRRLSEGSSVGTISHYSENDNSPAATPQRAVSAESDCLVVSDHDNQTQGRSRTSDTSLSRSFRI